MNWFFSLKVCFSLLMVACDLEAGEIIRFIFWNVSFEYIDRKRPVFPNCDRISKCLFPNAEKGFSQMDFHFQRNSIHLKAFQNFYVIKNVPQTLWGGKFASIKTVNVVLLIKMVIYILVIYHDSVSFQEFSCEKKQQLFSDTMF